MAGRGFITGSNYIRKMLIMDNTQRKLKKTNIFRRGGDHLPRLCQRKAYGPSVTIECILVLACSEDSHSALAYQQRIASNENACSYFYPPQANNQEEQATK